MLIDRHEAFRKRSDGCFQIVTPRHQRPRRHWETEVKGIANRRAFEFGLDALTNGVNDALKIRDDGPNLCGLSPYGIQPDQFATVMPRPTSCWTCVNASRVSAALGLGCLKIVPVCHGCFTSVHSELR
jgi:hypothetical protein